MAVYGDPNKFALIVERIEQWTDVKSHANGVFHFVIDQCIYPRRVRVSTLSADIGGLASDNALLSGPQCDAVGGMGAKAAFTFLLNRMRPGHLLSDDDIPDDFVDDYTYQASTDNLENDSCYVFAVGVGDEIRILGAKMESPLDDGPSLIADLAEVWVGRDEVRDIVRQVRSDFGWGDN